MIPSSLSFRRFESDPSQDTASTECVVVLEAKLLLQAQRAPGFASPPAPSLAGMPPPSRDVAPGPHWQRWLCGWAGAAAVASVVVISVSLCLVAACPPALLVPVVQDLEVSGLLFSSSFPSSSPATPRTPHLLVWLQCTPGSCGPASPCCSRSQADTHASTGRRASCPLLIPQRFPTRWPQLSWYPHFPTCYAQSSSGDQSPLGPLLLISGAPLPLPLPNCTLQKQ